VAVVHVVLILSIEAFDVWIMALRRTQMQPFLSVFADFCRFVPTKPGRADTSGTLP
jgi:hypothetical protein